MDLWVSLSLPKYLCSFHFSGLRVDLTDYFMVAATDCVREAMVKPEEELKISFGYQCSGDGSSYFEDSSSYVSEQEIRRNSSFSCLSGAALSANATLANTNICNGLIGAEILPSLDSPNSFRKIPSSPSLQRLDMLSSSLQSSMSNLSCSPSTPSESDYFLMKSMSAPSRSNGFLNVMEIQVAGGAAGEDRVQAVCSEENGWLFCAIYDGFNGRDAADFLAGTLYETIIFYLNSLDWESKESINVLDGLDLDGYVIDDENLNLSNSLITKSRKYAKVQTSPEPFRQMVLDRLQSAVAQAENDFLNMVEQEMDDRPDLVSVGSCVLLVLLHGKDLYTLNLGDSRAVLATYDEERHDRSANFRLKAVQLTESHTVDNEVERDRVLHEHPDDPKTIIWGKVKGKLKVTRAFGVGYLKKVDYFFTSFGYYAVFVRITENRTMKREQNYVDYKIKSNSLCSSAIYCSENMSVL